MDQTAAHHPYIAYAYIRDAVRVSELAYCRPISWRSRCIVRAEITPMAHEDLKRGFQCGQ
eukprot:scaffold403424_cov17-Prasinocladus_malaysianus.AAC.1